ncbi:MAG: GAF domain-containing protein [Anaerolineales bacterium]|nr:GAF domain-containing protein [Anaerolineales bacterium]
MSHSLSEEKDDQKKHEKWSSACLEERVAAQTRELAALNAIAAAVNQSLDLKDVLDSALDKTLEVMEIESGGIYLLDEGSGLLNIVAQRGFSPDFVEGIDKLQLGEGFSGRVAQSGKPMLVKNVSTDPRLTRQVVRDSGLRSAAIFPLSSKGKVLGTFFTIARTDRAFSEQDVQLLTSIGHQIGVAIENARLYEQAQQIAALGERNRLARELHDSVKQQALAASFQLGTAVTLFESDPQTAKKHLLEADNLMNAVRKELGDLILELRQQSMDRKAINKTIKEYAVEWANQSGIEVQPDLQELNGLSLEVKQALVRILQESLANVARHSSAECVVITLHADEDIQLIVKDDGQGFDPQVAYDGIGLQTMRERAESLDGGFIVESEQGEGTCITVTFPNILTSGEGNG